MDVPPGPLFGIQTLHQSFLAKSRKGRSLFTSDV